MKNIVLIKLVPQVQVKDGVSVNTDMNPNNLLVHQLQIKHVSKCLRNNAGILILTQQKIRVTLR